MLGQGLISGECKKRNGFVGVLGATAHRQATGLEQHMHALVDIRIQVESRHQDAIRQGGFLPVARAHLRHRKIMQRTGLFDASRIELARFSESSQRLLIIAHANIRPPHQDMGRRFARKYLVCKRGGVASCLGGRVQQPMGSPQQITIPMPLRLPCMIPNGQCTSNRLSTLRRAPRCSRRRAQPIRRRCRRSSLGRKNHTQHHRCTRQECRNHYRQ
ncbi:MAG: hypothetical protein BWY17_03837 [Deltaproteobacteria bacterium ADurb.Bin207]|nr:MAG: hypothetical protein BWY17_03837 [Deltaproteobacteria bacterium ADurb.Bin207]